MHYSLVLIIIFKFNFIGWQHIIIVQIADLILKNIYLNNNNMNQIFENIIYMLNEEFKYYLLFKKNKIIFNILIN